MPGTHLHRNCHITIISTTTRRPTPYRRQARVTDTKRHRTISKINGRNAPKVAPGFGIQTVGTSLARRDGRPQEGSMMRVENGMAVPV
eukprot:754293-Rhodomonas_salina.1